MNTIYISDIIGNNLTSRLSVRNLREEIINKNMKSVLIDFSDVEFASRSFMDEFYNVVLLDSDFKVEIINLSSHLQTLLEVIKSSQHNSHIYKDKNVKEFSTVKEVNSYLNTLSFI